MKRTLQLFLAIFFPWMVLLLNDDPIGALIALILQATLIGWIPASAWAWRIASKIPKKNKVIKNKTKPTSES